MGGDPRPLDPTRTRKQVVGKRDIGTNENPAANVDPGVDAHPILDAAVRTDAHIAIDKAALAYGHPFANSAARSQLRMVPNLDPGTEGAPVFDDRRGVYKRWVGVWVLSSRGHAGDHISRGRRQNWAAEDMREKQFRGGMRQNWESLYLSVVGSQRGRVIEGLIFRLHRLGP